MGKLEERKKEKDRKTGKRQTERERERDRSDGKKLLLKVSKTKYSGRVRICWNDKSRLSWAISGILVPCCNL